MINAVSVSVSYSIDTRATSNYGYSDVVSRTVQNLTDKCKHVDS